CSLANAFPLCFFTICLQDSKNVSVMFLHIHPLILLLLWIHNTRSRKVSIAFLQGTSVMLFLLLVQKDLNF
ncbi:hypothetical protein C2G38_2117867, partial [Gigaspora rosea]